MSYTLYLLHFCQLTLNFALIYPRYRIGAKTEKFKSYLLGQENSNIIYGISKHIYPSDIMYIPSEPLHNSYYNTNTTTTSSSTSTYNNTTTNNTNTSNTNTNNNNNTYITANNTTAIPNRGPKIGGRENYSSDYSAVEIKAYIESFYNHYNIEEVQILG